MCGRGRARRSGALTHAHMHLQFRRAGEPEAAAELLLGLLEELDQVASPQRPVPDAVLAAVLAAPLVADAAAAMQREPEARPVAPPLPCSSAGAPTLA